MVICVRDQTMYTSLRQHHVHITDGPCWSASFSIGKLDRSSLGSTTGRCHLSFECVMRCSRICYIYICGYGLSLCLLCDRGHLHNLWCGLSISPASSSMVVTSHNLSLSTKDWGQNETLQGYCSRLLGVLYRQSYESEKMKDGVSTFFSLLLSFLFIHKGTQCTKSFHEQIWSKS